MSKSKQKSITFRPNEKAIHTIESKKTLHRINTTKAILMILEEYTEQESMLRQKDEKIALLDRTVEMLRDISPSKNPSSNENLKPSTELSNKPNIDCIHYLHPNQCLKDWLKKGVIRKVNRSICNICLKLKQEQRQANKLKEAKFAKTKKSPTSTFYKKPAKIKCKITNRWEDPLKIRAQCERCKIGNRYKWTECQKEYIEQTLY